MTRRQTVFVTAAVIAAFTNAADARQTNDPHAIGAAYYSPNYQTKKHPGPGRYKKAVKARHVVKRAKVRHVRHARSPVTSFTQTYADTSTRIMPHPAGCPPRRFCGCGTAQRLLGKTVTAGGLAIAANWGGFPSAPCAPGMAAWRQGHVYAIEQCLPGNRVVAYDPNSGGGRTRMHVRSLAGYRIVNPHGAYTAVNGKPGVYRTRITSRKARRIRVAAR